MAEKGQIVSRKIVKFSIKIAKTSIAGIAARVRLTIIEKIMYTEYAMELAFIINPSGTLSSVLLLTLYYRFTTRQNTT
jgi:hypothetical protein